VILYFRPPWLLHPLVHGIPRVSLLTVHDTARITESIMLDSPGTGGTSSISSRKSQKRSNRHPSSQKIICFTHSRNLRFQIFEREERSFKNSLLVLSVHRHTRKYHVLLNSNVQIVDGQPIARESTGRQMKSIRSIARG
jgi:hypothetical protein